MLQQVLDSRPARITFGPAASPHISPPLVVRNSRCRCVGARTGRRRKR